MDVKVLEKKEDSVKMLFKGTDISFVNGLRRTMMAGMPVLAVEDVHFHQNTSVMFDEMLAHRLGMVPLKMDSKKYKEGDKVKLVLEKEGPATVYSKDIKSTDPKIEPARLNIPITKLVEGQTLRVEMDAIVGKGSEHVKWQPAIVSYMEMPTIISDKGKAYKTDVLDMLLDENKRDLILEEGQKVEYDPTTFIFSIESHGNLSPKELLAETVHELKEKIKEFKQELKDLS